MFLTYLQSSGVDPHWFQCGSGSRFLIIMRIRIQLFNHNADPDLDPGSHINADPDPDPGQTLKSQKVDFYMKNMLKVRNRSKKYTYEGTKAFLKGRKPGLFENFSQFTCSWIRIRIRIPNTNSDLGQSNECGSMCCGSGFTTPPK